MSKEFELMEQALKAYKLPWWKPIWWKFERIYDSIDYFLFPRQRWLTKQIPKDWCDKTELIADVLFACIIHFVEEEHGLENTCWYNEDKFGYFNYDRREQEKIIRDCYRWAKLRKRFDEQVWRNRKNFSISMRMEELYNKCEDHYLKKIIEVRGYLWT